jgi:antitoxin VapB
MSATKTIRHVRLFKNGRSQAVRIPRDFELPGKEAILRQDEKGRLILEPIQRKNLVDLLSTWKPLKKADYLPEMKDQPAEPFDL